MMINLQTEQSISLSAAAKLCSRDGRKPHISTVARWATRGIGPPGAKILLETLRIGGVRVTTPEAVERFIRDVTAHFNHKPSQAKGHPPDRIEDALSKIGI